MFFFCEKKLYLNFIKKHSFYKVENTLTKYLISYIDFFLDSKITKHVFNTILLFKIRILIKYLLIKINQVRVFSFYFLNLIELTKLTQTET